MFPTGFLATMAFPYGEREAPISPYPYSHYPSLLLFTDPHYHNSYHKPLVILSFPIITPFSPEKKQPATTEIP